MSIDLPLVAVFMLLLGAIGSTAMGWESAGGWTSLLLTVLTGLIGTLSIVTYILTRVTRIP
ncbi:MAG: hypothetical protein M1296_07570 [Chloroflexi bacterium]|nr:hypothetical protein [Chloroflexota bacterium]